MTGLLAIVGRGKVGTPKYLDVSGLELTLETSILNQRRVVGGRAAGALEVGRTGGGRLLVHFDELIAAVPLKKLSYVLSRISVTTLSRGR